MDRHTRYGYAFQHFDRLPSTRNTTEDPYSGRSYEWTLTQQRASRSMSSVKCTSFKKPEEMLTSMIVNGMVKTPPEATSDEQISAIEMLQIENALRRWLYRVGTLIDKELTSALHTYEARDFQPVY